MLEGVFKKACNDFDFFWVLAIRGSQKTETGPTPTTHTRAPMTLTEILRKSCAANNLGTTGSSAVLLARLFKSNKKTPAKSTAPKKTIAKKTSNKPTKKATAAKKQPAKKQAAKKCTGGKCKPHAAFKPTASGACRLSAAYYFYDDCDGKISRCTPQPIVQPDGCVKLKKIRLVDGPGGKPFPRWVLA